MEQSYKDEEALRKVTGLVNRDSLVVKLKCNAGGEVRL